MLVSDLLAGSFFLHGKLSEMGFIFGSVVLQLDLQKLVPTNMMMQCFVLYIV